jgi:hypothetical protein
VRDAVGDPRLQLEDRGEGAVEGPAPLDGLRRGADQAQAHPQLVLGPLEHPVHEIVRVEGAGDARQVALAVGEGERRGRGQHLQAVDLRQRVHDDLDDPRRSGVVLRVAGEVGEGQHPDDLRPLGGSDSLPRALPQRAGTPDDGERKEHGRRRA